MHFDYATIHACNALINATFGALFFAFWLARSDDKHFLWWAASLILSAASVVAFGWAGGRVWLSAVCFAGVAANVTLLWAGLRSFDGNGWFTWRMTNVISVPVAYVALQMFTGSQSAASAAATAGLAANVFLASIEFSRRSPTVGFGRNAVTWSLFGYIPFYAVSIGLGVLYEATRTGTTVILLSDIVLNIVFVVGLLAMTEERARSALFRLANFDPLTSSLNRRGLFDRGSAVSAERNCCVLVADLDHFKSINDTFGHAGGDAVLQAFVKTAQAVLGPRGLVGRLGGEEFAIVLVDAVHENGVEMAEAIRTHFLAAPVVWSGKSIKATVSIGVAASVIGQTFDETLQRADNALYRAKNDGRNQVAA